MSITRSLRAVIQMALHITRSLRGHYKLILQVCHYEVITNHFVMAL